MVLLVLVFEGEIVLAIHICMLLNINEREVNMIHQMIEFTFSKSKIFMGQLTILHLTIIFLRVLQHTINFIRETCPVEDSVNELEARL